MRVTYQVSRRHDRNKENGAEGKKSAPDGKKTAPGNCVRRGIRRIRRSELKPRRTENYPTILASPAAVVTPGADCVRNSYCWISMAASPLSKRTMRPRATSFRAH